MTGWLLLVVSYLVGAIPASYLAGRAFRGIDLREHGSGNLGATNAFRVLGPGIAAPVMLFDVLKGFVPTYFFPSLVIDGAWEWGIAFGAATVLGHVFPIYLSFRGGKGVATAAGVFLALAPVAVLAGVVVWIATLALSRMVSLASILAAVTLLIALPFSSAPLAVQALGVVVAGLVIFSHRANLRRILQGREHRFGTRTTDVEEEGQ
ncbi:MAG: glycerol-3-phosphate 1-O-acyltransferase PlsY [Gemmatimonadetes bacterium]|nr:glycerol-3-phosphate 1-O-acyltransferase PlsY [Gemmatimonadota bacterium]